MLSSIKLIHQRLLDEVQTRHYRFLYHQFELDTRLIGLVGARGVGKTTLLLQYLKNHAEIRDKSLYFSADHIYFSKVTLYEFIEDLYLTAGIKIFFIDEIHKYSNWCQELKNLYDGFPDLYIVFSGSSSLDLVKGSHDLSRRAKLLRLPGMSFREYLNFSTDQNFKPITYQQILTGKHNLDQLSTEVDRLRGLFQTYQANGYYPFSITEPEIFNQRLLRVIEKTIYEDVAKYYHLKTENLAVLKKILVFLASIMPGNINVHNIAKNLSVNDRTIKNYLQILQETGLIQMIYPFEGGHVGLRKPEKIFLQNTTLYSALKDNFGKEVECGTTRECLFIQMILGADKNIYFSREGDFQVDNEIFEIGGPNKTNRQIKNVKNSYLIKDELASIGKNVIPLLYFGFLY